jgi:hypothetical protein
MKAFRMQTALALLCLVLARALTATAAATEAPVHGMWIWKSASVLQGPQAAAAIRNFCQAGGINEVYISVPKNYSALEGLQLAQLITLLHQSGMRIEALISSVDADEPGAPRTKLLDHVQSILQFNRQHPSQSFDGIHLDIEPQQRPENKGPGNLQFLPALIDTYRAVRVLTDRAGLALNADIQNKLLKADIEQRQALLAAVPRLTLMLYELSSPEDGSTTAQKIDKLRESSQRFLQMAYQGVEGPRLARMAIALRTPDYGALLPQMLAALDQSNGNDPHYLGWARHSYNDTLAGAAPSDDP